jgi:hypothetical protein
MPDVTNMWGWKIRKGSNDNYKFMGELIVRPFFLLFFAVAPALPAVRTVETMF